MDGASGARTARFHAPVGNELPADLLGTRGTGLRHRTVVSERTSDDSAMRAGEPAADGVDVRAGYVESATACASAVGAISANDAGPGGCMASIATAREPATKRADERFTRAQMIALAVLAAAYIVVR